MDNPGISRFQRDCHAVAGFTLIELSIVLVIIGLVAGGILAGGEMIHAAKIRHEIESISKFQVAINVFRTKYNALPGDASNATQFFASSINGNGDGIVSGLGSSGYNIVKISEITFSSQHLAAANLINIPPFDATSIAAGTEIESGIHYQRLELSGGISIIGLESSGQNLIAVGLGQATVSKGATTTFGNGPKLSPQAAYQIDTKLDDGLPRSGSVLNASTTPPASVFPIFQDVAGCSLAVRYYIDRTDPSTDCGLKIRNKL